MSLEPAKHGLDTSDDGEVTTAWANDWEKFPLYSVKKSVSL